MTPDPADGLVVEVCACCQDIRVRVKPGHKDLCNLCAMALGEMPVSDIFRPILVEAGML